MNESIKILFIEDNPGDVFLFREMLVRAKLDFELFVRTSLKDAAESLTGKEKFDLLILDLSLPDSNGINTLVSIKSHSDDIPIIVLTGTNDYDTGASAIAEGAQDYLVKEEVYGTVLMRSIRYARERHRLLVELERASKKELKISENEAFKLKDEVARLNEEILSFKTSRGNKKAAYKDMAEYFAEMKSKDGADILSRLKDEDIIGIFNEMPKDLVAEMLQKMDRDKATTLTRKMLVTEP